MQCLKGRKSIADARSLDLRKVRYSSLRSGNAFSQQQAVPHRSPCLNSVIRVDAVFCEWDYLLEGRTSAFEVTGPKSRKTSVWLKSTVKVTRWKVLCFVLATTYCKSSDTHEVKKTWIWAYIMEGGTEKLWIILYENLLKFALPSRFLGPWILFIDIW
jgi:hypothetical protein